MSKTPGNFYECDRKSCSETAFVPAPRSIADGHPIFGMSDKNPVGWERVGTGGLYCPKCAKSFNTWNDGPKIRAASCKVVAE